MGRRDSAVTYVKRPDTEYGRVPEYQSGMPRGPHPRKSNGSLLLSGTTCTKYVIATLGARSPDVFVYLNDTSLAPGHVIRGLMLSSTGPLIEPSWGDPPFWWQEFNISVDGLFTNAWSDLKKALRVLSGLEDLISKDDQPDVVIMSHVPHAKKGWIVT